MACGCSDARSLNVSKTIRRLAALHVPEFVAVAMRMAVSSCAVFYEAAGKPPAACWCLTAS